MYLNGAEGIRNVFKFLTTNVREPSEPTYWETKDSHYDYSEA